MASKVAHERDVWCSSQRVGASAAGSGGGQRSRRGVECSVVKWYYIAHIARCRVTGALDPVCESDSSVEQRQCWDAGVFKQIVSANSPVDM